MTTASRVQVREPDMPNAVLACLSDRKSSPESIQHMRANDKVKQNVFEVLSSPVTNLSKF